MDTLRTIGNYCISQYVVNTHYDLCYEKLGSFPQAIDPQHIL